VVRDEIINPTRSQDEERLKSSLAPEEAAIQATSCLDFFEHFAGAIGEVIFKEGLRAGRHTANLIGSSLHAELVTWAKLAMLEWEAELVAREDGIKRTRKAEACIAKL